ncbi:MAG: DUF4224 domain-containing protein [Gammaproteobacteria bacterium]|nr:DUF4224 domain-containing protein [Gammaproteobacteria bacterium]
MIFLTADELGELTGYQRPALQRRWLAENGYSFDVRADGKPIVSRAHYEGHHCRAESPRPSAFHLGALDHLE